MVASDRISTYDVVHPTPIPDKGSGAHRPVGRSGSPRPATSSPTTSSRPPTACPTRCAAARWSCSKLKMLPVECVVRGYITGSGWKDYQATGARLGHRAAAGPARVRAAAEPIFTPSTKAEVGHDEAIDFDRAAELVGDRDAHGARARRLDRAVPLRRRARARARRDPGRHEVRVRPRRRRRARRRRRGADARLLALLARRRLRARPRRSRASTSSTCATGRSGSGWDKTPPAPAIPDDVVAGHARALRRGLRAHHRRAVRRLARADGARDARARAHPPEGGDPRPAGHRRRARAAGARLRRRRQRPRRPAGRARRRGPRRSSTRCAASCSQPADRGLRDPRP